MKICTKITVLGIATIVITLVVSVATVTAAAPDLDPVAIKNALDGGIAFLKQKQLPSGGWTEHRPDHCGTSALCVLALVSAGVPKDDPCIERAMNYLRQYDPDQVNENYAVSLMTMAMSLIQPDMDAPKIRACVRWLEKLQVKEVGPYNGGFTYTSGRTSDNSNAQFSILALYEAERVGISANLETWRRAREYWERTQNVKDGSWGYSPQSSGGSSGVRGSMTAAGIASLIMTSGVLANSGARVTGERILCCQNAPDTTRKRIQMGIDWLEKNYSVQQNPGIGATYYLYYMYALERVGRLTANRFIGDHDWYREGAAALLAKKGDFAQNWSGDTNEIVSTCFALLFLSKGRRPILVAKLEHGDSAWDVHPNDINNLTGYIETEWNRDLAWQVTPLEKSTVDDLSQSPVLFLCGRTSPIPKNAAAARLMVEQLREYLDQGGFLFAESLADDQTFDRGFRDLMRRVFPEEGYELRLLEPEHLIWRLEKVIPPDQIRRLEGIDFGCRTSVVYAPPSAPSVIRPVAGNVGDAGDSTPPLPPPQSAAAIRPSLSCLWELARLVDRGETYPPTVQRQIDSALGIGMNIMAYATNRELKYKDEIPTTQREVRKSPAADRGRLSVGLLQHGGGSQCAPRAIPRLMEWAAAELGVRTNVKVENVPLDDTTISQYPVLFMHGRTAFRLNDDERTALKKFIDRGGFLFVNSLCASPQFTDSVKKELAIIFPEKPLTEIPTTDDLWTDMYGGYPLKTVDVRIPQRGQSIRLDMVVRSMAPKMWGISQNDKWGVVFSSYDVSCALEKASTMECEGYTSDSAMKIGINILLYALER